MMLSQAASPSSRKLTPEHMQQLPVDQPLPEREAVRAIHVYDFDNTLFCTPLPNHKIWHSHTLGNLQSPTWLTSGGWWRDPRILAATGEGLEVEEKRAWHGWWNEDIVQLVQLSMRQKDALTVLLTGRSVTGFADLVQRIVKSRGLVFDMVVLKPEAMTTGQQSQNTLAFKTVFLAELLDTYSETQELRIYEDRVNHVRNFKDFCKNYTQTTYNQRAHLKAKVIRVAGTARSLDLTTELKQIQMMVDEHNEVQQSLGVRGFKPLRIKKAVFYTGYLLNTATSTALLNALAIPTMLAKENGVKMMANDVLITPPPASEAVLAKTGDFGRKVEFEVVGVAHWEHKVWAALVKPVGESVRIYTDNPEPIVVLAVRRGSKPMDAGRIDKMHWKKPAQTVRFDTVVGERFLLHIEDVKDIWG